MSLVLVAAGFSMCACGGTSAASSTTSPDVSAQRAVAQQFMTAATQRDVQGIKRAFAPTQQNNAGHAFGSDGFAFNYSKAHVSSVSVTDDGTKAHVALEGSVCVTMAKKTSCEQSGASGGRKDLLSLSETKVGQQWYIGENTALPSGVPQPPASGQ